MKRLLAYLSFLMALAFGLAPFHGWADQDKQCANVHMIVQASGDFEGLVAEVLQFIHEHSPELDFNSIYQREALRIEAARLFEDRVGQKAFPFLWAEVQSRILPVEGSQDTRQEIRRTRLQEETHQLEIEVETREHLRLLQEYLKRKFKEEVWNIFDFLSHESYQDRNLRAFSKAREIFTADEYKNFLEDVLKIFDLRDVTASERKKIFLFFERFIQTKTGELYFQILADFPELVGVLFSQESSMQQFIQKKDWEAYLKLTRGLLDRKGLRNQDGQLFVQQWLGYLSNEAETPSAKFVETWMTLQNERWSTYSQAFPLSDLDPLVFADLLVKAAGRVLKVHRKILDQNPKTAPGLNLFSDPIFSSILAVASSISARNQKDESVLDKFLSWANGPMLVEDLDPSLSQLIEMGARTTLFDSSGNMRNLWSHGFGGDEKYEAKYFSLLSKAGVSLLESHPANPSFAFGHLEPLKLQKSLETITRVLSKYVSKDHHIELLNRQDANGDTFLHRALDAHSAGGGRGEETSSGRIVIFMSFQKPIFELFKRFYQLGADFNIKNKKGLSVCVRLKMLNIHQQGLEIKELGCP